MEQQIEEYENIVFIVDGGIGKNIVATVPLRGIRKKYPDKKIIVICGYPDIFQGNPNVDRVYRLGDSGYFYEDCILNSKSLILKQEPYLHPDFIYKKRHIAEIWCEMLGVEFDNYKPDYFINPKEKAIARKFVQMGKKPLMLVQINGGPIPQSGTVPPKILVRDLPEEIAQQVVEEFKDKYRIIQIRAPTQPGLDGVEPSFHQKPSYVPFTTREITSLIPHAEKVLVIDSFMQHACMALGKKAVVAWGGTSPDILGYKEHINLSKKACNNQFCYRPNSFLFDMSPTRTQWECPFGEECMNLEAKKIIEVLENDRAI